MTYVKSKKDFSSETKSFLDYGRSKLFQKFTNDIYYVSFLDAELIFADHSIFVEAVARIFSFDLNLINYSDAIHIVDDVVSSTVRVSQIDLKLIETLYTLRKMEDVIKFVERHPFIVSILFEGYDEIKKYFPNSRLFLEVVTDYETIDDNQQLAIYISTDISPEQAFEKLCILDDVWWLDRLYLAKGKLFINLEFS